MDILFWVAASGLYLLWLWAPLAITLGVVLWVRARKTDRAKDYALLLALVAPWLFSAFWTMIFANPAPGEPMRFAPAVALEPMVALVVELGFVVALVVRLKRARRVAALLVMFNLYVALAVWFWGEMAIPGTWI